MPGPARGQGKPHHHNGLRCTATRPLRPAHPLEHTTVQTQTKHSLPVSTSSRSSLKCQIYSAHLLRPSAPPWLPHWAAPPGRKEPRAQIQSPALPLAGCAGGDKFVHLSVPLLHTCKARIINYRMHRTNHCAQNKLQPVESSRKARPANLTQNALLAHREAHAEKQRAQGHGALSSPLFLHTGCATPESPTVLHGSFCLPGCWDWTLPRKVPEGSHPMQLHTGTSHPQAPRTAS